MYVHAKTTRTYAVCNNLITYHPFDPSDLKFSHKVCVLLLVIDHFIYNYIYIFHHSFTIAYIYFIIHLKLHNFFLLNYKLQHKMQFII